MHTYDSIVSEVQPWATSANLQSARPFEVTFPGQEQTTSAANPFPRRPHEVAMAGQPATSQAGAAMVQTKPSGEADQLRWLPFSLQAPQAAGAIASPAIQTKLTVGQPNDQYEQEADQVAAQVLSMPDRAPGPAVQREEMPEEEEVQAKALTPAITPLVQREEMPEEEEPVQAKAIQRQELPDDDELQMKPIQREEMPEEEEPVQAKAIQRETDPEEEDELQMKPIQREEMPEEEEPVQAKAIQRAEEGQMQVGGNLESQLSSSQGGGSPLPADVRSFMEPRFGADFSQVRVHTGSESVQMNQDLQAQAFTHQQDIYYGAGKAPGNDALTAHELTHVVQQTGRKPQDQ